MSQIRTLIGVVLSAFVIFCFYFGYIHLLYVMVNLAAVYDAYYMYIRLSLKLGHVCFFLLFILLVHYYLWQFYLVNPLSLIKIITITQISDAYQYFAGSHCGITKIGWVSRNKSYEGYYFGFVATLATFLPIFSLLSQYSILETTIEQSVYEIVVIYWLGVASGLLSSLFKRLEGIKDYSDLLGPHGGWVDRIDSIILPIMMEISRKFTC